jgi:hypothetical protein
MTISARRRTGSAPSHEHWTRKARRPLITPRSAIIVHLDPSGSAGRPGVTGGAGSGLLAPSWVVSFIPCPQTAATLCPSSPAVRVVAADVRAAAA